MTFNLFRAALSCFVVFLVAGNSLGQTSAELLLKPWEKEGLIEGETSAFFENNAHVQDEDAADIQLSLYESFGRLRVAPGEIASPRLGYDVLYLDIDSENDIVPDQLVDASLAVGLAVGQFDGWIAGLTLGVGYAGDTPFGEGDAWYGKGTFVIGKELANDQALGFVVDYDGNRSIYPDIPLPGFFYSFRLDSKIRATIGLPICSINWTPTEQFSVDLTFVLIDLFNVRAEYKLTKSFSIYGLFERRNEAFHTDDLGGTNRLLFEQQRAEAGVKFYPIEKISIVAAGGYAFDQSFRSGFDSRETDEVANLSDEPYVRFAIGINY